MGKDTSHNPLRKQPPKLIPTDGANSAPVSSRPPHPLAELVVTTAISVGGSNAARQPLNPIFFLPISQDSAAGDPPSRRRRSQRAFELSRRSLPSFATANFWGTRYMGWFIWTVFRIDLVDWELVELKFVLRLSWQELWNGNFAIVLRRKCTFVCTVSCAVRYMLEIYSDFRDRLSLNEEIGYNDLICYFHYCCILICWVSYFQSELYFSRPFNW